MLVYSSPEALKRAMAEFIEYYNQRRYHEGIGNVAPADVSYGRREDILRRREEQKELTIRRASATIWGAGTHNQRATRSSKP